MDETCFLEFTGCHHCFEDSPELQVALAAAQKEQDQFYTEYYH